MAMRDLIPWRRQENTAPALFRDEERSPFVQLRREMDRLFDDFFRRALRRNREGSGLGPDADQKGDETVIGMKVDRPIFAVLR